MLENIKTKIFGLLKGRRKKIKRDSKKSLQYSEMDKSDSFRMEIRKVKTQRLIDKTIKAADKPGKVSISA